jgi:rhamnosyltransferase
MKISIIIPTYNAAPYLERLLKTLCSQHLGDYEILVIDSSSPDQTRDIAEGFRVRVVSIPKKEFDHGGTRTKAGKLASGDILVYLTQDALPADDAAVRKLINPFDTDMALGVTFGKQLPRPDATPFSIHRRLFNYPDQSYTREIADKDVYGLKAAFCSNSFAAYRRSALEDVGWFPEKLIMGEDLHVSARMLMKGYRLAYIAEAKVYHSHNYSAMQEFRRYFDLGVFFQRERWLLSVFGKPDNEGLKSVFSELAFLRSHGFLGLIPASVIRATARFIGYRLGLLHHLLPERVVRGISMYAR